MWAEVRRRRGRELAAAVGAAEKSCVALPSDFQPTLAMSLLHQRITYTAAVEAALAAWREFRETSIEEFKRVYDRMGVEFSSIEGESRYGDALEDALDGGRIGVDHGRLRGPGRARRAGPQRPPRKLLGNKAIFQTRAISSDQ